MCGLSGFLSKREGLSTQTLEAMHAAIAHRGPDSTGVWNDPDAGIGMVHRRLAVVDLSPSGHQPMMSKSGRYMIAYNGEIYNHLDIRKQLEKSEQQSWHGHSDTETLLAAINAWGIEKAVKEAVGMFAFAVWDRKNRTLTLCRDRIGEKPLYYGRLRGTFYFASELKAIEAVPGFDAAIDTEALQLYFRHNYIPTPYSIYKGISKLEPGCILTVSEDQPEPVIKQFWSAVNQATLARTNPFSGTFEEATNEVEKRLLHSVQGQMNADVPLGAFLSGGIDSSTIVALMQQTATSPVKTFSIGFDDPTLNEATYAKSVAEILKTDHTELYLSDSQIQQMVQDMPAITDEPFADSSLIPTYAVSKLARSHVTVSLSGDGGDELFGGYSRYRSSASLIKWRRRLGSSGRTVAKALLSSKLMEQDYSGKSQWASQAVKNQGLTRKMALALRGLGEETDALSYRETISYWNSSHAPVISKSDPKSAFHMKERWIDGAPQEGVQMMDLQTYLPDDILVKVDRAAMNQSLETRVPLLDHRLLEFIWSLPVEFRADSHSEVNKPILNKIVCQYVPKTLINRPKMGFGIPINTWLRGPLREWAEDLLSPSALATSGVIDVQKALNHWKYFLANDHASAELVWSIIMFQHWAKHRQLNHQ